jgi:hypothetical protein
MYCQHCGAESTQGLNYCNRCGGNLGALAQAAPREVVHAPLSTGAMWAVGGSLFMLVVCGLGVLGAMMTEFVHSGVRPEPLVLIMLCGAFTILASVFMLTRFWMRMLSGRAVTTEQQQPSLYARPSTANDLGPQRFAGSLPDAPATSVTEHTTRTLEHAKRK